jgi:hypothetical protein
MAYEMSGPLFNGQAEGIIDDFLDDAREIVSARLLSRWMENMDRAFKNPTPYYETQVLAQIVSDNVTVVHDRGIVYGPPLEWGHPHTSFRGYHSLTRAHAATEQEIPELLAGAQARMVARLNGST